MPPSDARTLLDAHLIALEGGLLAVSPARGRGMIERWLQVLADHPELADVAANLRALQAALSADPLDAPHVGSLLRRLGARTVQAAAAADDDLRSQLERLGGLLTRTGEALAGLVPPSAYEVPDASGPAVQQPSSLHGKNPANPGRKSGPVRR